MKILNRLLNTAIVVFLFLMVASLINKYSDTHPWVSGIFLVIIGMILYLGNVFLIQFYIRKRAPEFANDDMWEMTAGTGIVPKWISSLGLLAFPAFIAALIWFIAYY